MLSVTSDYVRLLSRFCFRLPRPLPPDLLFDPLLPTAAVPCAFASGVLGADTGLSCCLSSVAAASGCAELS